jgi:hypothetical protein
MNLYQKFCQCCTFFLFKSIRNYLTLILHPSKKIIPHRQIC